MNQEESYIFNQDSLDLFSKKLKKFHEEFKAKALLCGMENVGDDIESIKFSKSPKFTLKYYQRIVGGFKNVPTFARVKSFSDSGLNAECFFNYLNYDKHIDNVFMLQNVMNWAGTQKFCCTIWSLKSTSISNIKEYWNA